MELHVDSSMVVHTLQFHKDGSLVGWRLIQKIRRLLALEWKIKVCHSYRETNACADALAYIGCDHGSGLRMYEANVTEITTPKVVTV